MLQISLAKWSRLMSNEARRQDQRKRGTVGSEGGSPALPTHMVPLGPLGSAAAPSIRLFISVSTKVTRGLLCQRLPQRGFVTPFSLAPQSRGAEIPDSCCVFISQEIFTDSCASPRPDRHGQVLRLEHRAVEWKAIPVNCPWAWAVKGFTHPNYKYRLGQRTEFLETEWILESKRH